MQKLKLFFSALVLVPLGHQFAMALDIAPGRNSFPAVVRSSNLIVQAKHAELLEQTDWIALYRVAIERVVWSDKPLRENPTFVYLTTLPKSEILGKEFAVHTVKTFPKGTVIFANGPMSIRLISRSNLSTRSPAFISDVFSITSDTKGKLVFGDDIEVLQEYLAIAHRAEPSAKEELQWARKYRHSKPLLEWLSISVLSDLAQREGEGSEAVKEFCNLVLSKETDETIRSRALDYAKWCGHDWAQKLLIDVASNDDLPEKNRIEAVGAMINYSDARSNLNQMATSSRLTDALRKEVMQVMNRKFSMDNVPELPEEQLESPRPPPNEPGKPNKSGASRGLPELEEKMSSKVLRDDLISRSEKSSNVKLSSKTIIEEVLRIKEMIAESLETRALETSEKVEAPKKTRESLPSRLLNDLSSNDYQRQLRAAKNAFLLFVDAPFTEEEMQRLEVAVKKVFDTKTSEPLKLVFIEGLADAAKAANNGRVAELLGKVALDPSQSTRVRGAAILRLEQMSGSAGQTTQAKIKEQIVDPKLKRLATGIK